MKDAQIATAGETVSRMAPDAPPMESSGTAERTMIYGGRVLIEKVTSEWQGETFEGTAMTGFDNVAGSPTYRLPSGP